MNESFPMKIYLAVADWRQRTGRPSLVQKLNRDCHNSATFTRVGGGALEALSHSLQPILRLP